MGGMTALVMIGLVCWLSRRRLSLAGELATAVSRRELAVHYQPIIDLRSGRCVGAEALVRWQRPGGKQMRPDVFIAIAEENGILPRITAEVFRLVIRDMEELLAVDRGVHISVNLGASDMKDGEVLRVLERMLLHTSIEPRQIWLEATERGFMDVDTAGPVIAEARRLGHAVAIDDFGTGYSSLAYLQRLPLDSLKIDKTFVDAIGTDSATHKVTEHIIGMARSLNLLTVAEGIERQDQADYLKAREVDFGQGWLYGVSMPAAEFIKYYLRNVASTPPPQRMPGEARRWPPEPAASRLRDVKAGVPQWRETSWSAAAPAAQSPELGSKPSPFPAMPTGSPLLAFPGLLRISTNSNAPQALLPIHRLYLGADFPDGRRPGAGGKTGEAMKTWNWEPAWPADSPSCSP